MAAEDALKRLSLNLAALLADRMFRTDVSFSFGTPRPIPNTTGPRLNIFLYRVIENPAFRNDEDPRRAVSGGYGSPPLPLELGYLLTSYGNATDIRPAPPLAALTPDSLADLDAQFILADAMRVLHDVPIISRRTQRQRLPAGALLDPGLQTEFESLRIAPRSLNLDELSKLWTALKDDFQRSVTYDVSVIRIEQRRPSPASGPVLNRGNTVQSTVVLGPSLDGLNPDSAAAGDPITLIGSGLDDLTLQVFVSDAFGTGFPEAPQSVPVVRDPSGVHFSIPNDPANFMPGPKLVELRVTTTPGHTVASNSALLKLLPKISNVAPLTGPFNGTVTVTVSGTLLGRAPAPPPPPGTPPFTDPLTPTLLFGSFAIPVADLDLSGLPGSLGAILPTPAPDDPHRPITGQKLAVRVRVNGVESQVWKIDPVTKQLVMDPNLQFSVA
jgi:hypothetical protein